LGGQGELGIPSDTAALLEVKETGPVLSVGSK
jgi:hypothetical protein